MRFSHHHNGFCVYAYQRKDSCIKSVAYFLQVLNLTALLRTGYGTDCCRSCSVAQSPPFFVRGSINFPPFILSALKSLVEGVRLTHSLALCDACQWGNGDRMRESSNRFTPSLCASAEPATTLADPTAFL